MPITKPGNRRGRSDELQPHITPRTLGRDWGRGNMPGHFQMKSTGWACPRSRGWGLLDERPKAAVGARSGHSRVVVLARLLLWLLLAVAPSAALAQGEPTPLHEAALADDAEAVERLIVQGASVDAKDSRGLTPLHWAASRDARKMVKALLAHGAGVDAKDDDGHTALDNALNASAGDEGSPLPPCAFYCAATAGERRLN